MYPPYISDLFPPREHVKSNFSPLSEQMYSGLSSSAEITICTESLRSLRNRISYRFLLLEFLLSFLLSRFFSNKCKLFLLYDYIMTDLPYLLLLLSGGLYWSNFKLYHEINHYISNHMVCKCIDYCGQYWCDILEGMTKRRTLFCVRHVYNFLGFNWRCNTRGVQQRALQDSVFHRGCFTWVCSAPSHRVRRARGCSRPTVPTDAHAVRIKILTCWCWCRTCFHCW